MGGSFQDREAVFMPMIPLPPTATPIGPGRTW